MENSDPNNISKIQHVAKSSSDQLLRKFAEVGSEVEDRISAKNELRLAKRAKRTQRTSSKNELSSGNSLADRLLPPVATRKPGALIRRLGMNKTKIRAKDLKNKSIIRALEKTWRKTMEGASRILLEKHYNSHKRLLSDLN